MHHRHLLQTAFVDYFFIK